jgi:hypothetical protein
MKFKLTYKFYLYVISIALTALAISYYLKGINDDYHWKETNQCLHAFAKNLEKPRTLQEDIYNYSDLSYNEDNATHVKNNIYVKDIDIRFIDKNNVKEDRILSCQMERHFMKPTKILKTELFKENINKL